MNLDDRLKGIRSRIAGEEVLGPLPTRAEELSARVEYLVNAFDNEKHEIAEHEIAERGLRLPRNWEVLVHGYIDAAIKPATLSLCKRWELKIKARLRLIGEWLFRITS